MQDLRSPHLRHLLRAKRTAWQTHEGHLGTFGGPTVCGVGDTQRTDELSAPLVPTGMNIGVSHRKCGSCICAVRAALPSVACTWKCSAGDWLLGCAGFGLIRSPKSLLHGDVDAGVRKAIQARSLGFECTAGDTARCKKPEETPRSIYSRVAIWYPAVLGSTDQGSIDCAQRPRLLHCE